MDMDNIKNVLLNYILIPNIFRSLDHHKLAQNEVRGTQLQNAKYRHWCENHTSWSIINRSGKQ